MYTFNKLQVDNLKFQNYVHTLTQKYVEMNKLKRLTQEVH